MRPCVNEDFIIFEPTHFSSQDDKSSGEPALREEEAEQPVKLQARKALGASVFSLCHFCLHPISHSASRSFVFVG